MRASLRLLVPCAVLALAASAAADTLKVPQDFPTIGAAAAIAQDGDTISVAKGTYLETVVIDAPNVKLVGKKAVIDAQFGGNCITVNADGCSLSGFTLVNGFDGVHGNNPGLSVSKCVIATCSNDGIHVEGALLSITSCTVTACGGHGINYLHVLPGNAVIDKNVCRQNGIHGIFVDGDDMQITRNRCELNEGNGIEVTVEGLTLDGPLPLDQPVVLEKNDCLSNEDNGIHLSNGTGSPITLHDNDCSDNCDDGIFLDSPNCDIQGNHCDHNRDEGLDLSIDHSVVSGNSGSDNQGLGMRVTGTPPVVDGTAFATGDSNTITKNTCNDNAGDGIQLDFGSSNSFQGNKCSGNGDDGMDIQSNECLNTSVDGNNFTNNGHEGLDNGGTSTDVTKNTCKGNGFGNGPDIAGKGDNGMGGVDAFQDNKFDTGGESATSRLDNYANTTP
jgi:parallel beta-helix repeat protein